VTEADKRHWGAVAQRAIAALGIAPKSNINLRDHAGRSEVAREFIDAASAAGHQVILDELSSDRLRSMLEAGGVDGVNRRALDSIQAAEDAYGVIVLSGDRLDLDDVAGSARDAWQESQHSVASIDERRRTPFVLVAVPTAVCAKALGFSLDELDERVLPAMDVEPMALSDSIRRVLAAIEARRDDTLTIRSGSDCTLILQLAPGRPLHSDDGRIDAADRAAGAVVTNLPAGSVYTTVDESTTCGNVWFAHAGPANDATLTFEEGRIVGIRARSGADQLLGLLNAHSGEPRRIGHVGVGLNPHIHDCIGWTLVDDHRCGAVFLSLGENRYMGGQNASSLNIDFVISDAMFDIGASRLVERGKVIV
jgi:leucyl aminopeptidase (aminopeptidase T)